MRTQEQIKNEYAVSKGFSDWEDLLIAFRFEHLSLFKFKDYENEVMKIYAMECLKLASENVLDMDNFDDLEEFNVLNETKVQNSITNENNIIK